MASPLFTAAAQPMTEEEYFALGETVERIELVDGILIVSPHATYRHQRISKQLVIKLDEAARTSDLEVLQDANLRLGPDRIFIPDLVVATDFDDGKTIDASVVRLVCEITSPSNAANDRLVKMNYYATAGIPWYLLIEQDPVALHLYRLVGDTYSLHSLTNLGEVLELDEPLVATIDSGELLRR